MFEPITNKNVYRYCVLFSESQIVPFNTLALTHTIGRSLARFGAQPQAIDTEGYRRLLRILEVVENDTWQLFEDMNRYNPYARDAREAFITAMHDIEEKLRGKNRNARQG